jgi:hypothetical protein
MIPKEIIEKAIEGGWKPRNRIIGRAYYVYRPSQGHFFTKSSNTAGFWMQWHEVALDREFWICLGKALGWDKLSNKRSNALPKLGSRVSILPTRLEGKLTSIEKDLANVNVKGVGLQKNLPLTVLCFVGKDYWYWEPIAHRFYDLILTNQPTDTFWQEIINANK